MKSQLDLFGSVGPARAASPGSLPEGFRYLPDAIAAETERQLLDHLRALPFRDFEFHGYTGKRRVVSYGWQYDFESRRLNPAEAIPPFLIDLRARAATFSGVAAASLQQVLVTEYAPGAGIGWHRDKAEFGDVVGLSLLAPCVFRFRRASAPKRWDRAKLILEPRSAYLLRGRARFEWEHSIPPVASLRYSITFRSVRSGSPE